MSELVPHRPNEIAHAAYTQAVALPPGAAMIRAWAMTAADAHSLADMIADTPFLPDSYRPKLDPRASLEQRQAARTITVQTAAAAMMHGTALGFDPMSSLLNVYIVGGRPGLYAAAAVALLQAAGHEVWTEDLTASRAVVCGRRRGSEFVERVEVTMDMARKAGWTRNQKYASEPDSMLWARAASRVCRRVAQDVLKGLPCVEDMQDGDDSAPAASPLVVSRAALPELPGEAAAAEEKPKPARAPRKKAAAGPSSPRPAGETGLPPLPGEDDEPPAPAPEPAASTGPPLLPGETGEFATAEQFTAIATGFRDLGITGPARREYVAGVLGRAVADPKELTGAEAAAVIDSLLGPPPEESDDTSDHEQGTLDDTDEST